MEQNILFLSIRNRLKSIPYGASDGERPDGSKNFGFKRLKGNREITESIPEAKDSETLQRALGRLNDVGTAFFTVGCEKSYNTHEKGFLGSGVFRICVQFRRTRL